MMERVEGECSKDKEKIDELDHIHVADIKELIKSPITSKMRIKLFLREWEKVKRRENESLICKT